jgi:DNA replication ATP-dependent helicase Dna2
LTDQRQPMCWCTSDSRRCFGDMIIESYSNDIGRSLAKIHRHTYTFVRAPASSQHTHSLLSGHIAKGDPVSLSIEPDLLCLSRGFVVDLTPERITVGVTYVIDTAALLARTALRDSHKVEGEVRFRIDKDEMASGMQRMRNNLAQLFFANGDEKRRRLIVDLEKPTFEPARAPLPEEIPASLNEDQRRAMNKVFTARDYALILGMPGTGKTTTIAEIIKALVERGKTVLLASYTHSAVDTILTKLLNAEFGVLRLGNIDKVRPCVICSHQLANRPQHE